MKRNLLTLAVLATFSSLDVQAGESQVTFYGQANMALELSSKGGGGSGFGRRTAVASNGSRLGWKGWETLGAGWKAVFLLEVSADGLDSGTAPGGSTLIGAGREGYVGMGSDEYGTVALGFFGQPYKTATGALDVFAGIIADYASIMGNANGVNLYDTSINNSVIYFVPKVRGFSGQLQYGFGEGADHKRDRWGVSINYSHGPWYLAYAHAAHKQFNGTHQRSADKLAGSYVFNATTTLIAIYESLRSGEDGAAAARTSDHNAWYVGLIHKLGNTSLRLAHARASDSDGNLTHDGARFVALGISHAFTRRTEVYGLYARMANEADGIYGLGQSGSTNAVLPGVSGRTPDAFALGIKHSF